MRRCAILCLALVGLVAAPRQGHRLPAPVHRRRVGHLDSVHRADAHLEVPVGDVLQDLPTTTLAHSLQARERGKRLRVFASRLAEHIPAVVYVESMDADPDKFYVGPQVTAAFGYTPDEWKHDVFEKILEQPLTGGEVRISGDELVPMAPIEEDE